MSSTFAALGNDLYTGRGRSPSSPSAAASTSPPRSVMAIAVLGLVSQGLTWAWSSAVARSSASRRPPAPGDYEQARATPSAPPRTSRGVNVTLVGNDTVRVQTERLSETESQTCGPTSPRRSTSPEQDVSGTFIGPSWGASVSQQALRALVIFLARRWRSS